MTDLADYIVGDAMHATVTIERDFDGKWAARWPSPIVSCGLSAGAGRHETKRDLIAAIEDTGWSLTRDGDKWTATLRKGAA